MSHMRVRRQKVVNAGGGRAAWRQWHRSHLLLQQLDRCLHFTVLSFRSFQGCTATIWDPIDLAHLNLPSKKATQASNNQHTSQHAG
jgi:hypothetical protein